MRKGLRDLIFGATMLLVAAGLWWETTKPQYQVDKVQDYGFDPAFFPRILIALWLALALTIIVQSLGHFAEREPGQRWGLLGATIALTVLYAGLMTQIGFLLSSVLFAAAAMLLLGFRRPVVLTVLAIGFPLATWYAFNFLLNIPLPTSPWFTRI